jgi:hypothetical protein
MLEKYKNLIGEVETILGILDDETRRYDYKRIHCINVKRYNDYVDIDKIIENYDLDTQKKIKDKFTDNYINDIYYYFIDDLSNSLMSELGELEDEFGFYGRSGGWFGYEVIHLENYAYDLIDNYNRYLDEDAYDIQDIKDEIDDIYDFIDLYNKYNNILIKAKEYNENTSFKDELEYQIKEYINN